MMLSWGNLERLKKTMSEKTCMLWFCQVLKHLFPLNTNISKCIVEMYYLMYNNHEITEITSPHDFQCKSHTHAHARTHACMQAHAHTHTHTLTITYLAWSCNFKMLTVWIIGLLLLFFIPLHCFHIFSHICSGYGGKACAFWTSLTYLVDVRSTLLEISQDRYKIMKQRHFSCHK